MEDDLREPILAKYIKDPGTYTGPFPGGPSPDRPRVQYYEYY